MDAQATMRLMFDTMDAYDRADFDRLAEIYAEDAQWRNADPTAPTASTATTSMPCSATAWTPESGWGSMSCVRPPPRSCSRHGSTAPIRWSRCSASRDAASWPSRTTPRWRPPRQRSRVQASHRPSLVAAVVAPLAARIEWLIQHDPQRSTAAALWASRSLSPITVAPELTGRGAVGPQVASRSNSRKKS
jgi:hypothetical protein